VLIIKVLETWPASYDNAAVIFDGFVKSSSAALRCILSHCGVQVSTPHSVGFARLASEAFYCAV
jgi:hypothetical protein